MYDSYSIKNKKIISYYDMLADKNRNKFFYDAIQKTVKDKVVLDLGSGTGILSHYALTAGAKFVFAVEQNPNMAKIIHDVLKTNFDESKFKVICSNFWSSVCYEHIDKIVDVVVSETVAGNLFDEGMLTTWSTLKKYLNNNNLISIPDCLSVDAWLFDNMNELTFVSLDKHTKIDVNPTNITKDELIDENFFNALAKVDTALSWENTYNKCLNEKYTLVKDQPKNAMKNIFRFTYQNATDNLYPTISTTLNLEFPCVVALINKIEFENNVMYLKDAKTMPWRFSPSFIVTNPGKYDLRYGYKIIDNTFYELRYMLKKLFDI